jgi:hypothetical protein
MQDDLMGRKATGNYTDASGRVISAADYANLQAPAAAAKAELDAIEKSLTDSGAGGGNLANNPAYKAALARYSEAAKATAGMKAEMGANEFTQDKTFEQQYGGYKPGQSQYDDAARQQAFGDSWTPGFTQSSIWNQPAADAAEALGQTTQLDPKFAKDNPLAIAQQNAAQQGLNQYVGSEFQGGGYQDKRQTSGERAALGQAGQLQGVGGQVAQKASDLQSIGERTPTLGAMAADVGGQASNAPGTQGLVRNALQVWQNTQLPTLQNQAALMGLGRSNSLLGNISNSQQSMLLPIMQQQMGYENEAAGRALQGATSQAGFQDAATSRALQGATANAGMQQWAGGQQQGREEQAYQRQLYAGNQQQAQAQAANDAAQADFQRRQALAQQQQGNAQGVAGQQAGIYAGLSAQDTARQFGAAQALQGMADKDQANKMMAGDFNYQDFLRKQGLGENSLYQIMGGMGNLVGSTTTGGGK